jgi:hypothetical protein
VAALMQEGFEFVRQTGLSPSGRPPRHDRIARRRDIQGENAEKHHRAPGAMDRAGPQGGST